MKQNILLLSLTCLFNFALSAYTVNPSLMIQKGDNVEVDWSFESSLVLENWNIFVEIAEDFIHVKSEMVFRNKGESADFMLGFGDSKPSETETENTETLFVDSKKVVPASYEAGNNSVWNVITVHAKANQSVKLKKLIQIKNCNNYEEYLKLDFVEFTYDGNISKTSNNFVTVKNNTIDRILYRFEKNGHGSVQPDKWLSDDTFEIELMPPPVMGHLEFYLINFLPQVEQGSISYMKNNESLSAYADVFDWIKRELIGETFFKSDNYIYSSLRLMPKKQLRLFRNSVYALHGRTFKDKELQKYFSALPSYKVNSDFKESDLTEDEKTVVNKFIEIESKRK